MALADWLILALATATPLLGMAYARRYRLPRPPLGTMNLSDVVFVAIAIVAVPFVYLALPGWLVAAALALSTCVVLGVTLAPVLRRRAAVCSVPALLTALDIVTAATAWPRDYLFFSINDTVIVLVAIGVANLWAQGGIRPRDLAILAAALTVYDAIATGWLAWTQDMLARLATLPFLPAVALPRTGGEWSGIGLGDLLIMTVGPLVLRRVYGMRASMEAIATQVAALIALTAAGRAGWIDGVFPTMVVLGPVLIGQIVFWSSRTGDASAYPTAAAREPGPMGDSRRASLA